MKLIITPHIQRLIDLALDEDDIAFDVTSNIFFESDTHARLVAKEDLVLAGQDVFKEVFKRVDPKIQWEFLDTDGARITRGTVFANGHGDAGNLLRAERTALNFLQRMCGVATLTRQFVDALGPGETRICDTRKTMPGWRVLDKYSVSRGGGATHRLTLSGGVMLKDNHLAAAGGVERAMELVRDHAPHTLRVEVEVESLEQTQAALDAGAEIIMLDNMSQETMREAVALIRAQSDTVLIEASGNMTLERLGGLQGLGLDFISVGALTHSVTAADISMKLALS